LPEQWVIDTHITPQSSCADLIRASTPFFRLFEGVDGRDKPRTAGEGGDRSEAGEGLAAVVLKIDQFALYTALVEAGIAGTEWG
jgi:hypothetical protein